jgi:hypothetical protein
LDGWESGLEELPATFGDSEAECFKWVWNEAEGANSCGASAGQARGGPFHEEQLREAWGREPSPVSGDVLGIATDAPNAGGERALVSICAYFGAAVPASIAGWFLQAFPDAELRKTSS